jgi:hypothetical protein
MFFFHTKTFCLVKNHGIERLFTLSLRRGFGKLGRKKKRKQNQSGKFGLHEKRRNFIGATGKQETIFQQSQRSTPVIFNKAKSFCMKKKTF